MAVPDEFRSEVPIPQAGSETGEDPGSDPIPIPIPEEVTCSDRDPAETIDSNVVTQDGVADHSVMFENPASSRAALVGKRPRLALSRKRRIGVVPSQSCGSVHAEWVEMVASPSYRRVRRQVPAAFAFAGPMTFERHIRLLDVIIRAGERVTKVFRVRLDGGYQGELCMRLSSECEARPIRSFFQREGVAEIAIEFRPRRAVTGKFKAFLATSGGRPIAVATGNLFVASAEPYARVNVRRQRDGFDCGTTIPMPPVVLTGPIAFTARFEFEWGRNAAFALIQLGTEMNPGELVMPLLVTFNPSMRERSGCEAMLIIDAGEDEYLVRVKGI
jgi:hypothetical protein